MFLEYVYDIYMLIDVYGYYLYCFVYRIMFEIIFLIEVIYVKSKI